MAGFALRGRSPLLRALVYRTTLVSLAATALFSVGLAGRLPTVWHLALPLPEVTKAQPVLPRMSVPFPDLSVDFLPHADRIPLSLARLLLREPLQSLSTAGAATPAPDHKRFSSDTNVSEKGRGGARSAQHASTAPAANATPEPVLAPVSPNVPARTNIARNTVAILVGAWSVLTVASLLWLLCGYMAMRRLRGGSLPVTEGAAAEILQAQCRLRGLTAPLLLANAKVTSPCLVGWRHPAILLPASYSTDFDTPALRAILAHELMHLERQDCLWTLLTRLICALFWVQPLLWALVRQLEQANEEICDLAAIEANGSPRAYADCLLTLAERRAQRGSLRVFGVGVMPFRSSLGRRVRAILAASPGRARLGALSASQRIGIALFALCVTVSSLLLVSANAAPQQKPTPTQEAKPADTIVIEPTASPKKSPAARTNSPGARSKTARQSDAEELAARKAQEEASRKEKLAQKEAARSAEQAHASAVRRANQAADEAARTVNQAREAALRRTKQMAAEANRRATLAQRDAEWANQKAELQLLQQERMRMVEAQRLLQEDQLLKRQADLQAQLENGRLKYTSKHPRMQELQARLDALNRQLDRNRRALDAYVLASSNKRRTQQYEKARSSHSVYLQLLAQRDALENQIKALQYRKMPKNPNAASEQAILKTLLAQRAALDAQLNRTQVGITAHEKLSDLLLREQARKNADLYASLLANLQTKRDELAKQLADAKSAKASDAEVQKLEAQLGLLDSLISEYKQKLPGNSERANLGLGGRF